MDKGKLKNIILIALALLDLVFLVLLGADERASAGLLAGEREDLVSVLAEKGITLSQDVDIGLSAPEELLIRREMESEARAVKKILGNSEAYDQGGNYLLYTGRKGEAVFRGSGEFVVAPGEDAWTLGGEPEALARKFCRKLGLDPERVVTERDDSVTVRIRYRWHDSEIFNTELEFLFSTHRLMLVSGQRCFDRVAAKTGAETLSCTGAILRFTALRENAGTPFSEILAVTPGYVMNVSVSGSGTLTPAWRIETDAGVFCLNAVSGQEELI